MLCGGWLAAALKTDKKNIFLVEVFNMFNIGPTELLLVLGVALIVFGPASCLNWARLWAKRFVNLKVQSIILMQILKRI